MIVMYFIMFLIVGMILGYLLDDKSAIMAIVIISVLWAFIFGPWALATFIELLLGYGLVKKLKNS